MNLSFQLNIDWFPPSEASLKRARMKKLIQELVDDHSPVTPEPASSDGLAFLSGRSSLSGIGDNNSFLPTVEPGIEMNLLERTPTNDVQFGNDQGSVYREFFEPGSTAETFPHEQYRAFDQHSVPHTSKYGMSPIEVKFYPFPVPSFLFLYDHLKFRHHRDLVAFHLMNFLFVNK